MVIEEKKPKEIFVTVEDQKMDIHPPVQKVYEGEEVSFVLNGADEACLNFIAESPFDTGSMGLKQGRPSKLKVTTRKHKTFGYVVSTNPAGGGTIHVIPRN